MRAAVAAGGAISHPGERARISKQEAEGMIGVKIGNEGRNGNIGR